MSTQSTAWEMVEPGAPLHRRSGDIDAPRDDEVLIQVAGCGVCHTDIGFLHGGVRTRHSLPLVLGHEIAGTVVEAGSEALLDTGERLGVGDAVIVPAVLPCGECPLCRRGRDNICQNQKMPGNDLDGGFATHVRMPARFLIPVGEVPDGHDLAHLAVIADAVTTPYQAMVRAQVHDGDAVIVIGVGGVGIFGVQIASLLGAKVLAVDVQPDRLQLAVNHGAADGVCTAGLDESRGRKEVAAKAEALGFPRTGWKIFETSGTAPGQRLGFSLLNPAGTLAVVGFTREKLEVRLSNLMAFDAEAFGSWGCSPRHYAPVLQWIREGRIQVKPFVTFHPLSEVNTVLDMAHHGGMKTRPVLVPEA